VALASGIVACTETRGHGGTLLQGKDASGIYVQGADRAAALPRGHIPVSS